MHKYLSITVLIFATLLLSCKKEDEKEPETTEQQTNGKFSAKIDGTQFPTTNAGASYTPSFKTLVITGVTKDNRETINLTINGMLNPDIKDWSDWKAQTYSLDPMFVNGVVHYITAVQYNKYNDNISGYDMWQNDSKKTPQTGKVIITEISDKHIKGTFFFDSYKFTGAYDHSNVKKITEGTFDVDVTIK